MTGTAMNIHAIATVSPQTMLDLQDRARARTADILEFASNTEETDFYLKHYDAQRLECCQEGDIEGAILAELILTELEKALAAVRPTEKGDTTP